MDESVIRRIQPHSQEAEQSLIGAVMLDNKKISVVENIVAEEDFYVRQNGIIYGTIVELYEEGKPVDPVTLQNRLKEKDLTPEICELPYIGEWIARVPVSANAKYYAQIVADKALTRRLIHTCEEITNTCYAGKEPLEEILQTTEKDIFGLLNRRQSEDFVPIRDAVLEVLEQIHEAYRSKNPVTGISTGFTDLDYMTAGLHPSELVLIAARPAMGKTAFALNIAEHAVFRENMCVAVFSLEMSRNQLIQRLLAMGSRVNAGHIRTGELDDGEWEKLFESINTIGSSKLIIDDTPGISVSELRTKCRKYKLEHDLKMVVIDYLQLMTVTGRRIENKQQEITEISRSLKALARELQVPVVALSQLNRAAEGRQGHRPQLSDLRESGSIEQDADVVLMLFREDYYVKDTESLETAPGTDKKVGSVAEVIIAKQRNGATGTVQLAWLPQYTKFVNIEK